MTQKPPHGYLFVDDFVPSMDAECDLFARDWNYCRCTYSLFYHSRNLQQQQHQRQQRTKTATTTTTTKQNNTDMDVKFNSKDDLENWLKNQSVEEAKAGEAAEILFHAGFDNSDTLAGITSQQLQASGIRVPLAVYLSNRLPSPQQLQEQLNENIAHGVFVLYRGDDKDAEPIGTTFAISPKLLLTACHNVVVPATEEGGESVVTELKVASKLIKSRGKVTTVKNADGTYEQGTPVSVYRYNRPVDWACLKRDDEDNAFPFIITVGTQASDVPQPTTREKLFIYHCPVQLFLDDDEIDACHVMVKEASIGIINQKTLNYQNGAFPGSCGGPYIFRNKAVALHVDSISTTKTADDLRNEKAMTSSGRKRKLTTAETALMVADSCASSHSSLGTGILLYVRSGIMDLLQE